MVSGAAAQLGARATARRRSGALGGHGQDLPDAVDVAFAPRAVVTSHAQGPRSLHAGMRRSPASAVPFRRAPRVHGERYGSGQQVAPPHWLPEQILVVVNGRALPADAGAQLLLSRLRARPRPAGRAGRPSEHGVLRGGGGPACPSWPTAFSGHTTGGLGGSPHVAPPAAGRVECGAW